MNDYLRIKDICRYGLIKHLENACIALPRLKNPNILDIGCGSGVPTLWLAENFSGNITAIDLDKKAINYLQNNIAEKNLQSIVKTYCASFFDLKFETEHFDIILAEGFLNVVGFEKGFKRIIEILKRQGYFILHDEYKDHNKKLDFISENNCILINTLTLDENIWWNDYYNILENEINKLSTLEAEKCFKSDIDEINLYKAHPSLFKSIYYIIKKI